MSDIAQAAASTGVGLLTGGIPGGLITLGSAILSGLLGMQDSPSEEAFKKMFDELYANMDFLKETPFTKEELFNTILPVVQNTFRRGADVAAAKIGSTIPESVSGVPQGQAFMDFFVTALAPQIAQGEQLAGQANIDFVKLWSDMDTTAKQRFLQAIQVGGNLASGLPGQTPGQKFVSTGLQGADISSTIQGNVDLGQVYSNKAQDITSLLGDMFKKGGNNVTETINNFIAPRKPTPAVGGG